MQAGTHHLTSPLVSGVGPPDTRQRKPINPPIMGGPGTSGSWRGSRGQRPLASPPGIFYAIYLIFLLNCCIMASIQQMRFEEKDNRRFCAQRAGAGGNPAAGTVVSAFQAFWRRAKGFAPLIVLRAVHPRMNKLGGNAESSVPDFTGIEGFSFFTSVQFQGGKQSCLI